MIATEWPVNSGAVGTAPPNATAKWTDTAPCSADRSNHSPNSVEETNNSSNLEKTRVRCEAQTYPELDGLHNEFHETGD